MDRSDISSTHAGGASLSRATLFRIGALGMAARVDALEPIGTAVFIEHALVQTCNEIHADSGRAALTGRTESRGLSSRAKSMALVVEACPLSTLEVEEADRVEVCAAAIDAEVAIAAFGVIDAPTLTVWAGSLIRNTDPSIIAGQSWPVDRTIFGDHTHSSLDAESCRASIGDVTVPVYTFFVGFTDRWSHRDRGADSTIVAGIPVATFCV